MCECVVRGMDWDTNLHGKGWTVKRLLSDLYEKAASLRHWGLIRMVSGMLRRKVEELDEVTDILLIFLFISPGTAQNLMTDPVY